MNNIETLRAKITEANNAYRKGNAIISDEEYDALLEELSVLSENDELLNKVGIEVLDDERKQALPVPMFSMNKVKTLEELRKWIVNNKIPIDTPLVIMPKFDGLSLCVDEQNNKAWTRGDGFYGQRSDEHFRLVNGRTNQKLPFLTIGEVIMSRKSFTKYAEEFQNPRNLVAGLMNSKEPNEKLQDCDYIRFGAFNHNFPEKSALLDFMNSVSNTQISYEIKSIDELTEDYLKELFFKWNTVYELDGLIIEINDMQFQNHLGRERNNNPVYARAFKGEFEEVKETSIIGVNIQVSKQGYLKPVIQVDPIRLDGVTVSNVTGNNMKYMIDMGLGVGAKVKVKRSGMVIPKIIGIVERKEFVPPAHCQCGRPVVWNDNKVELCCTSDDCEAQNLKKIISFFEILEVDNVSEGILKQFYDAGYDTVEKILRLTEEDMLKMERFGKRKAEITYNNIKNKMQGISKSKLQHATGIFKGLGSKKLALLEHFETKPTIEEVVAIEGFSEISARAFIDGFDKYQEFVKDLPITTKKTEKVEALSAELEGKQFVFTGIRRADLEAIIQSKGGTIGSGVSKNTSYLVMKEKGSGSSKEKKAESLGVAILTVGELEEMLGN